MVVAADVVVAIHMFASQVIGDAAGHDRIQDALSSAPLEGPDIRALVDQIAAALPQCPPFDVHEFMSMLLLLR